MVPFLEEFFIGSVNTEKIIRIRDTNIGPGKYLALDLSSIEEIFDRAELRAMSRSGLALRMLARKLIRKLPPSILEAPRFGTYVLAHDGECVLSFLQKALHEPAMKASVMARALPPKLALSISAGTSSAQVAIEAGARGPILTIQPTEAAIDLLLKEIETDSSDGLLRNCLVGFANTFEDPMEWRDALPPGTCERAVIIFLSSFDSKSLDHVRGRLRKFLFDEVRT